MPFSKKFKQKVGGSALVVGGVLIAGSIYMRRKTDQIGDERNMMGSMESSDPNSKSQKTPSSRTQIAESKDEDVV